MKVSIQKTDKLLNRLAGALILVASILFTGCPNKITVKPETFAVTFGAGDHGTVEASVDGKALTSGSVVQKDKTVDFTAKPKDSIYEVEKWTVSGGKFEAKGQPGDTTAKVKVTAETTVTVTFKRKAVPVEKITVTVRNTTTALEDGINGNKLLKGK